jgi:Family of unknown function (DUF6188)
MMIKTDDHWILPIKGCTVSRILIDFRFGLELIELEEPAGVTSFYIGCPFSYCDADGRTWILDPEGPRPALAPALALFGQAAERVVVHEGGKLEMAFNDGSILVVEPDPKYEAWEASGAWGLVVARPGSGLAIWSS